MPQVQEVKRSSDGTPILQVKRIPLSKVELELFDNLGELVNPSPSYSGNPVRTYQFKVKAPGIDPNLVTKVELPTLDYDSLEIAYVTIYSFIATNKPL